MSNRITWSVPDVSCNHCVMTIERELSPMEGIESVKVDLPTKTVTIEYEDNEALQKAKETLTDIGYPPADA